MGVEINGKNRWDIQVHDNDFYAKLATYNSLALGEAYIDESITIEDVLECVYRLTRGELFRGSTIMEYFNTQTKSRLSQAIKTHYGIDSEVFEATLDPAMLYSAGYWREATTLDDAQIAKMDLIGKKLMLKPGMKVLDIGCGWGGIAHHLAQNFGVHVVGITISIEQVKYAKEKFSHPNVEIQLVDYRDFKSNFKFDRVISIEMIEHIGEGNYTTYFKGIRDLLKDDGIFLLQTSGVYSPNFSNWDPFIHKYVFPDLLLTRQHHMTKYIDGLFCIEDWHDIGYDLSRTLAAWADNFERAWPSLRGKHGDEFYRMWTLFLRSLAGVFRSRKATNWQLVMSKNGTEGGYLSVR